MEEELEFDCREKRGTWQWMKKEEEEEEANGSRLRPNRNSIDLVR